MSANTYDGYERLTDAVRKNSANSVQLACDAMIALSIQKRMAARAVRMEEENRIQ